MYRHSNTTHLLRDGRLKDDDAVWRSGDEKGLGGGLGPGVAGQGAQQGGYIAK